MAGTLIVESRWYPRDVMIVAQHEGGKVYYAEFVEVVTETTEKKLFGTRIKRDSTYIVKLEDIPSGNYVVNQVKKGTLSETDSKRLISVLDGQVARVQY